MKQNKMREEGERKENEVRGTRKPGSDSNNDDENDKQDMVEPCSMASGKGAVRKTNTTPRDNTKQTGPRQQLAVHLRRGQPIWG